MGKQAKMSYGEMVEHAVQSCKGDKVSRRRIKEYIESEYSLKVDSDPIKTKINQAITDHVEHGILAKDKDSFKLSPKGRKQYAEAYGHGASSGNGEDDDDEEKNTPTKKIKGKKGAAAGEEDE